jgi:carbamoyl-phosphate synthase large subunit
LFWPLEKKEPNVITYLKNGKIDLVINIPKSYQERELTNGYLIRRTAADFNVMLITNRQIAMRFIEAISRLKMDDLKIRSWGEY